MTTRGVLIRSAVGVLALTMAASALASSGGHEKIRYTKAGQEAARAATLVISDFRPGSVEGGAVPVPPERNLVCPGFDPKQSDLVDNGDAKTSFTGPGVHVENDVTVFQTAGMLTKDWQRSIGPQLKSCLRTLLGSTKHAGERFVSVDDLPFPKVSTYTHAYRVVISVTKAGKVSEAYADFVILGWGRTETFLSVTAPADPNLLSADVTLAKALAGRIYV